MSQLPAATPTELKAPKAVGRPARLVKDAAAYAAAKHSPKGPRADAIPQKAVAPASSAPTAPKLPFPFVASFPGISLNQELSTINDGAEPPDTQMAAGPTTLMELVNVAGQVFHKDGSAAGPLFRLSTFFGFPSTYPAGDPRVLFDPSTQRWYATALGFNGTGSQVRLNVSTTSNPMGTWRRYLVYSNAGLLCDQPKLGYSSDKLMIGCSDFNGTTLVGGVMIVASKTQALAGAALTVGQTTPNINLFGLVPAQNMGPGKPAYIVFNERTALGIITISGDPATGLSHVFISGADIGLIVPTSDPPQAPQSGSLQQIDTGDDRFMSAVVQGPKLWTSATTGCTPAGDTSVRSCASVLEFDLPSQNVDQETINGMVGKYLFYPTLALDANNNVAIDYSLSSASEFPSHGAMVQRPGDTVPTDRGLFQTGAGPYTGIRWGDYGAAATDPTEPTRIWVAGEYSDGAPTGTSISNWNTGIGAIDFTSLNLSLTGIGFGSQLLGTTSGTQSWTLTNSGDFDVQVTAAMGSGDTSQFSVANNTCASTLLAPAATCTADFTFHPTTAGLKQARFNVSAPHYGPLALVLSGTGAGPRCASTGFSADVTSPHDVGATVTLTSTSSGCPNPSPLYQFRLRSPAGVWSTVRAFSNVPTFAWNTTGFAAGTYLTAVLVKDASSASSYDAYASDTFTLVIPYCTSTNIAADKTSPQPSTTTVTFTATASPVCTAPRYQWWINKAGVWTIVPGHDFAHSTDTYVWNTTGLPKGTYQIGVWARQAGSTKRYDAFAFITYTLVVTSGTTRCQAVNIAPSPPSPSDAGTPVTLTATAVSCTAEYRWWVRDITEVWHIVKDYPVATNSYVWTATTPGTYLLGVWVRQTGSLSRYEAFSFITYTLTVPPAAKRCSAAGLAPSVPSPQAPGTTVTFAATATGCGAANFRFFVAPPGGALVQSQAYGASTFDWHTTGLAPGVYQVAVWARRTGSTASYDAYALITFKLQLVVTPCTTLTVLAAPSQIVPADILNRVQLASLASGCPTPMYRLYLRHGAGAYVFWGYPDAASSTFTVGLHGMAGGPWTAEVLVKDASSPASYDSVAYTDFQVR